MNEMFSNLFDGPIPNKSKSELENLIKSINNLADETYFTIYAKKFPLTMGLQEFDIKLVRSKKDGKQYCYFHEEGMELLPILKRTKKYLERWKDNHKEYNIQKPGGGEMI